MAQTVGDSVIHRLYQWGVRLIYGFPGEGIRGLTEALSRASKHVGFVQVRHEEMAASMACAHAKFTDDVGVCMATAGPEAIHLLNRLCDAQTDRQPVVAMIGQQRPTLPDAKDDYQVDWFAPLNEMAHQYVFICGHPAQARDLMDRAIGVAKAERCVTCVIFSSDILEEHTFVESPEYQHGPVYAGTGHASRRIVPAQEEIRRAAEILNAGKRVAMLVGAGALEASEEVAQTAAVLGAGVAKALLGKAVLPDDLPFVTGSIGLLGTEPSNYMMKHCDTLLMVGTSFPYSEWLPKEGQARAVHIDSKPHMLGLRYSTEFDLCGDSADTLHALLPMLRPKQDRAWRQRIEKEVSAWWKLIEERAMNEAAQINPQRVFWELSSRLPHGCILTSDSGSAANLWARDLKIRSSMKDSFSGNLATMGPGLPYAVAAKFVHPGRPVVACVGDGAMQRNGNHVLITVAKYWDLWDDPRLVVLVVHQRDRDPGAWEQPQDFGYAEYARMLGLEGIVMKRPEDIRTGWDRAFSMRKPVIVDAYTDSEVLPLPPHITFASDSPWAIGSRSRL